MHYKCNFVLAAAAQFIEGRIHTLVVENGRMVLTEWGGVE
jgi:hypothetical protein